MSSAVIKADLSVFPEDEDPDLEEPVDPADASDLDFEEMPCTDDDSRWEAFIPDEDERDPLPDPGDFWIENGRELRRPAARVPRRREPE
jgi:hypothetical protein